MDHLSGGSARRTPLVLLLAVLLGGAVFVLTQGPVHGRTYDEPLQDDYGRRVLAWYLSGHSDRSFLDFPDRAQVPQHGPFFETLVAGAERAATGVGVSRWTVRTLVCGLTGLLGLVLVALAGKELRDWWTGLLAAVGLALYPRYTGAVFNNSKDVPLTVALLAVLWLVLRLVRRWRNPSRLRWVDCALVGVALGLAASIRITALLWVPIVVALAVAAALGAPSPRGRAHATLAASAGLALIGISTYLTILLAWPFVWLHPWSGLRDAFASMSRYQWNEPILFGGAMVPAMELPRTYALRWLWLGSPPLTVALAVVGSALVVLDTLRRRASVAECVVLASLVVPLTAVVGLHSTLYNGLRHVLFVVPAGVLLGAWAVVRLATWLRARRTWTVWVVAGLAAAAQVPVVVQAARLYPYEYMYFNDVAGGFTAQHDDYETDYWGACTRAAMLWLDDHRQDYVPFGQATVRSRWAPPGVARPYAGDGLTVVDPRQRSDFVVYSLMSWRPRPWPRYHAVHEVEADGVPLCEVEVSDDL